MKILFNQLLFSCIIFSAFQVGAMQQPDVHKPLSVQTLRTLCLKTAIETGPVSQLQKTNGCTVDAMEASLMSTFAPYLQGATNEFLSKHLPSVLINNSTTIPFPERQIFPQQRIKNTQKNIRLKNPIFISRSGSIITRLTHDRSGIEIWQSSEQGYSLKRIIRSPVDPRYTITHYALSPNGAYIAASSGDDISLYSVASGEYLQSVYSHSHTVTSLAFSHSSTTLASGDVKGRICIWDKEDNEFTLSQLLSSRFKFSINSLSFNSSDTMLITNWGDVFDKINGNPEDFMNSSLLRSVFTRDRFWSKDDIRQHPSFYASPVGGSKFCFTLSPDDQLCAISTAPTIGKNYKITIMQNSTQGWRLVKTITTKHLVAHMEFSNYDNSTRFVYCDNKIAYVFDTGSWLPLATFKSEAATSCTAVPQKNLFIFGSNIYSLNMPSVPYLLSALALENSKKEAQRTRSLQALSRSRVVNNLPAPLRQNIQQQIDVYIGKSALSIKKIVNKGNEFISKFMRQTIQPAARKHQSITHFISGFIDLGFRTLPLANLLIKAAHKALVKNPKLGSNAQLYSLTGVALTYATSLYLQNRIVSHFSDKLYPNIGINFRSKRNSIAWYLGLLSGAGLSGYFIMTQVVPQIV